MQNTIKTLDINAKEWFDRINGNSYFSGQIIVNYGLTDEKRFFMPFQYGYGDSFQWQALKNLQEIGLLANDISHFWQLRDKGIIIRTSKRKALKRELKEENY